MSDDDYLKAQTETYESSESDLPGWREGQRRYLDSVSIDKGASILDVACGDGNGLEWFKDNGYANVTGCDLNPRKVERAGAHGYPVLVQDIHRLTFPPKSFDVVYSSHTLEHANYPRQALLEFKRVMKDGGQLLLVLPFPDQGPLEAHCGKTELKTDVKSTAVLWDEGLLNVLSECGFDVTSKKYDSHREFEIWLQCTKRPPGAAPMVSSMPRLMNLDLCCGPRKQPGHYGIDIMNFPGVDRVHDLNDGIPLPDNSCDSVYAHDAIEHLYDGMKIMKEIWRVLKPDGKVDILVPSTDGRGAFQDLTHHSFWNENSFKYWINQADWMHYYHGGCVFMPERLYTTPLNEERVCHVVFVGYAIKGK